MLLGGDEISRSQQGNNNAYCQDNEINWFDWERIDHDLLGIYSSPDRIAQALFRNCDDIIGSRAPYRRSATRMFFGSIVRVRK